MFIMINCMFECSFWFVGIMSPPLLAYRCVINSRILLIREQWLTCISCIHSWFSCNVLRTLHIVACTNNIAYGRRSTTKIFYTNDLVMNRTYILRDGSLWIVMRTPLLHSHFRLSAWSSFCVSYTTIAATPAGTCRHVCTACPTHPRNLIKPECAYYASIILYVTTVFKRQNNILA